jgi:hypothetical protein
MKKNKTLIFAIGFLLMITAVPQAYNLTELDGHWWVEQDQWTKEWFISGWMLASYAAVVVGNADASFSSSLIDSRNISDALDIYYRDYERSAPIWMVLPGLVEAMDTIRREEHGSGGEKENSASRKKGI